MPSQKNSWKSRREAQQKKNFIGRKEQQATFRQNLESEEPDFLLFSVTGEGGVGKSTLLEQFETIATATLPIQTLVVKCEEKHASPAEAMGFVAEKLKEEDFTHKEFEERFKKFRELRQEIESDPKAPHGALEILTKGVTDFAIKSAKSLPGVGVALESLDS
ncbi:MAG: ATP-binding protein, partial [Bacteroidota bacterium]